MLTLGLLVLAVPAGATSGEPVGGQIHLFTGPTSYPAGQAFHIVHGYGPTIPGALRANGKAYFALEVDGEPRAADYIDRGLLVAGEDTRLGHGWVFNFPDGMSGTHTFTGRWFVPCSPDPLVPTPTTCESPAELVEGLTATLIVEFDG